MFPRERTRSEEIATGGAPDGGDLHKFVVIKGGSWKDGGGSSEVPEADPVNEARRSPTDRPIGSPFTNEFPCDDELELCSPPSFPCATEGTLALAGRIFLV